MKSPQRRRMRSEDSRLSKVQSLFLYLYQLFIAIIDRVNDFNLNEITNENLRIYHQ